MKRNNCQKCKNSITGQKLFCQIKKKFIRFVMPKPPTFLNGGWHSYCKNFEKI